MTAAAEKLASSLQHYRAAFDAHWSGGDPLTELKRAAKKTSKPGFGDKGDRRKSAKKR